MIGRRGRICCLFCCRPLHDLGITPLHELDLTSLYNMGFSKLESKTKRRPRRF